MINKLIKTGDSEYPYKDEEDCHYQSKADYLQIEILGFCGCGDPDDTMLYVKEMLERLDNQNWGDYEDRPYMFFVYWANHKGFAEHGTTARCSWLTGKGSELLADINLVIEEQRAANSA